MNGAQSLVRTLVGCGVDVCFMNPGTSEMHFVATLDAVPEMKSVLALFEGVATGAADGYGRMTGTPAATLLHLGPGLGNGLANLHNARRARTPLVNIVGDHATYHKKFDAPLESDIEGVARNVSSAFVRWGTSPETLGADTAEAFRAALGPPGQVATLVVPADVSWGPGGVVAALPSRPRPQPLDVPRVTAVADALRSGAPAALLLGNGALGRAGLLAASRVANTVGAKFLCETFPARVARGAGIPEVERLAYLGEMATAQLEGVRHLILVDAKAPVSFFAYPERPSWLVPDNCEVHVLAGPSDDAVAALEALAEEVGAPAGAARLAEIRRPELPVGELNTRAIAAAVGALLPEGAIVSDEGNTSGLFSSSMTAGCPPHDWLFLTGGAIGQGLPVAVGAATACPDRPVVSLQADGSALYTLQSWWTMARYGLDVTTVLFNNHSYAILNMELQRVGVEGARDARPVAPRHRFRLPGPGHGVDGVAIEDGRRVRRPPRRRAGHARAHPGRGDPPPARVGAIGPGWTRSLGSAAPRRPRPSGATG
jgi:acetolactate synthase-1/2/3 large subunit